MTWVDRDCVLKTNFGIIVPLLVFIHSPFLQHRERNMLDISGSALRDAVDNSENTNWALHFYVSDIYLNLLICAYPDLNKKHQRMTWGNVWMYSLPSTALLYFQKCHSSNVLKLSTSYYLTTILTSVQKKNNSVSEITLHLYLIIHEKVKKHNVNAY